MRRDLVVAEDPTGTAVAQFLEIRPRTLALSGGHTPRPFYERLATVDYQWRAVDVFFGDERCVPPTHPDSNFRMANEALLQHVPVRVHRMVGESCDAAGYEAELTSFFGSGAPAFDLVLQGLGPEGHTASLFPGDSALDERTRLVVRVERPDHARLTLTLPVLSAAKVAMFLVTGAEKRDALRVLMEDGDIPAARIKAARVIVIADAEAAAAVPESLRSVGE